MFSALNYMHAHAQLHAESARSLSSLCRTLLPFLVTATCASVLYIYALGAFAIRISGSVILGSKTLAAAEGKAVVKSRPKRAYLAGGFALVAATYLVEAGIVLLASALAADGRAVPLARFWTALMSTLAFSIPTFALLAGRRPDDTDAVYLQVVIFIGKSIACGRESLTDSGNSCCPAFMHSSTTTCLGLGHPLQVHLAGTQTILTRCRSGTPGDWQARALLSVDLLRIFPLACLIATYQERLRDAVLALRKEPPAEKPDLKPARRAYDLITIVKRLRMFLPYVVPPNKSGLLFLLVSALVLEAASVTVNILLPRQLGLIVADMASGKSPWQRRVQ